MLGGGRTERTERRAGRWPWTRLREWAAALLGVVVVCTGLSACQVSTRVAVTANGDGSGQVAVTVTLDPAALAAVGGLGQLQAGDLRQAGWSVGPPQSLPGGGASVGASKPFATPPELSAVLASLAGSGPAGARPFHLTLTRQHSLWSTQSTLRGAVDLRCGTACFGDSGLQQQTGSPVGVDPGRVAAATGTAAAQGLTFSLVVTLPGHVRSTDAAAPPGGHLEWTPVLGQTTTVMATTTSANTGAIAVTIAAAALILVVLLSAAGLWWRRGRRRRVARRRAARRAGAAGSAAGEEGGAAGGGAAGGAAGGGAAGGGAAGGGAAGVDGDH